MGKQCDLKKLEEVVTKIKELGLSYYVDGAREFGIPVRRIYEHKGCFDTTPNTVHFGVLIKHLSIPSSYETSLWKP